MDMPQHSVRDNLWYTKVKKIFESEENIKLTLSEVLKRVSEKTQLDCVPLLKL